MRGETKTFSQEVACSSLRFSCAQLDNYQVFSACGHQQNRISKWEDRWDHNEKRDCKHQKMDLGPFIYLTSHENRLDYDCETGLQPKKTTRRGSQIMATQRNEIEYLRGTSEDSGLAKRVSTVRRNLTAILFYILL